VYLTWESGHRSQHSLAQVYKRCPQRVSRNISDIPLYCFEGCSLLTFYVPLPDAPFLRKSFVGAPSLFAFKYCTSIELILTSLIRSFKRDKAAGEVVDDDD
jgi:hypothetical protein